MMKLGRMNWSLVYMRRFVLLLSLFLPISFFFAGCSKVERKDIGNNVDSPIAMASHPTKPISYVLNAVLGGEYDSGSVQSLELSATQPIKLLGAAEAPRLGTALAVASNGAFLMAGFSGSTPEIRVYPIDNQGLASPSTKEFDRVALPSGRVGTLKLVQLAGREDWNVVVSIADRSFESKIVVYRYTPSQGFQKLLAIPEDFYTPSRENVLGAYTMSWGSPVVFDSLGILVAFPYGTLGYLGTRPSAIDWLTAKADSPNATADLRIVSAVVVDLNRLSVGQNVGSSLGFVPLAFNAEGKPGNAQNTEAAENKTFEFRTSYQSATAIDASGSTCQPNALATALVPNTAVVVLNNKTADLVALGGFNSVANDLRLRLDQGQLQPVLGSLVQPQPLYVATQSAGAPENDTLIPSMQLVRSNNLCTLMWLRVERGRSLLGGERSQFQALTAAVGSAQAQLNSPLEGMAAFAVNGSFVLGGSFGTNQLQQFVFDGSNLQPGGLFK